VRVYRPLNAMACVLTPMAGFEVVRKAAAHPDVLIPYGHVSVDEPGVVREIQTFADAGFKGVKMHRPKYNWDDFGYFPIYERLQSLRLVALFHTGIVAGSSDEPEPSSMAHMRRVPAPERRRVCGAKSGPLADVRSNLCVPGREYCDSSAPASGL
jgi:predicted TIM-barrel fold metal-dependent hydrolase